MPIVTVVASVAEERNNKHRRIDAVVPSLTTQYGTLKTVSKSSMSNDKLFNYFDEHWQGREKEMVCENKNCICLNIFHSSSVCEAVAKYLVWFEQKEKYASFNGDGVVQICQSSADGWPIGIEFLLIRASSKTPPSVKTSPIINCAQRKCS